LRILVCSSEVVPFAKTGGLADVAGALPRALAALGHEVHVVMPFYGSIDTKKAKPKQVATVRLLVGEEEVEAGIAVSGLLPGVPTYLVDAPRYFHRRGLYGEPDDAERFSFFCRAVLEFLRHSEWRPEVLHCNDWQTALLPVYLKTTFHDDAALAHIGTLLTVHNLAYQGLFDPTAMATAALDPSLLTMEGVEFYGEVSFLKGGLMFADVLNTVSKTYAREIQTPEYGERLEGVLARRRDDLFGVLNGLDYEEWNAETDPHLAANYRVNEWEGKLANKTQLQRRFKLTETAKTPLLAIVSRLASQKGLDLLAEVLPHLLEGEVQFVLLGTGEPEYHRMVEDVVAQFPGKMGALLGFDNALAHQVYAGADMFLMPSHYEPCGLGQLISLRYGTVPVVRRTGGLADTVEEFDPASKRGTGFLFEERTGVGFLGALCRALTTYGSVRLWRRLMKSGMACDYSWGRSAGEYVRLYERAAARHGG
jgi:starch synthase